MPALCTRPEGPAANRCEFLSAQVSALLEIFLRESQAAARGKYFSVEQVCSVCKLNRGQLALCGVLPTMMMMNSLYIFIIITYTTI